LLILRRVLCAQGVELAADVMPTLGNAAGGDMRKAITILQSAARLHGARPCRTVCFYNQAGKELDWFIFCGQECIPETHEGQ
jgi:DNA polymerase III delta prime subunit